MKQTNNAIKFLMAQYRAIFNNAYFKGLATAALVTVAMAAGQAQANPTTLTGSLVSDATKAQDIIATGKDDKLTVSGDSKFAKTITVQNGAQLTISGAVSALGDVNVNGGTLIISDSSSALLLGAVKVPAAKSGDAKQHYEYDLNATAGSTLTLNSGNIGVANFDIAGSTITLTSGGTGGTNLTAYGVGAYQDTTAPANLSGKAVGNLTDVTANISGGSNITAIGTLNVSGSTLEKSKINLTGDAATSSSHTNFAYLEGSKQLNISKTTITVSGASGSALSSRELNLVDSKLDVQQGTLTIGTDYDVNKAAGESNPSAVNGTATIKNTNITIATGANLNFGASGSTLKTTISGGTITNSGTVNVYAPTVDLTADHFNGLVESGKLDFKESSVANVKGNLDLTKKVLSGDGTLNSTIFAIANDKTLTLSSDGAVTLGKAFAVDKFTVEAGVLKLTPDTSNSANTFTQTSGSLVALNGLTSANETTLKEVIVSGSASAKSTLTLGQAGTTNGTVTKVDKLTVKGQAVGNEGTLNINGKWNLSATDLNVGASGAANLANAANVTIKNLTVDTNGALNITDGSLLTVDGTVTTAENKVALTDNSKLSVKYAEADKTSALAKVKLDGSSTLVLTGYEPTGGSIDLTKFGEIKKKFIGDTGLLKLDGVTINSGVAQNADVTYTQAQSGTGAAGVFDTNTVTGVTGDVAGSNDWGTVELANGQTELSIAANGAITLNGNGSNKLVADSTGATDAGVKLASGSILTVEATGTIKEVVAANDGNGKFIVGGNGTANTVTVTNNLGSDTAKLDTVNVIADSTLTVKNVYAKTLDLGGNLQATSVKLSADSSITGELKAEKLEFTTAAQLAVGEGADNGLLEVKSLDLKGGKLVLDPEFGTHASVAAINQTGAAPEDIVYVKANGDIGVGKNSVFAVGLTTDAALDVLRSNGYLDANNSLIENKLGSAIVLDQGMSIAAGDAVFLDSTGTTATLSKKISDKTGATGLSGSGGYMELGANTGLVITGKLFDNATTKNKEIIQFAGTTNTTLQLNDGSKLVFDVTDAFGGDSIKLTNATTLTSNGKVSIEAANGMLVGNLDTTNKGVTFAIAQDAKDKLYNQSNPVKDLTYDVMAGNYKDSRDENGVAFIGAVNGQDGGKAIEETARLAVYGGAVQATNLAQQAANDAVVERMSRANPNGSLVFANNAQGGGLWLSPVYKSLESDSFDADGVDYGVDADLTGLVLGGDFTAESGVRAGAYFNFGSASVDGQGVGDQVSNDADYFGFGLYTGMTFGQMSLVADAGFTQVSNDVEQNINHKDFSKAKASFDSSAVTLGLRGEYKLNVATMDVTPHLGVRYTRLAVDGYDAKVDGYTVATTDVDTMQMFAIPFGVSISKDIVAGSWTIKPVFDLTLTANAGDTDTKLDTTFIGTKTIGLTSEAFDSFTYGATMGIDAKYGKKFSIGLNTNYVGSSNTDEFGVMGNVRYMF